MALAPFLLFAGYLIINGVFAYQTKHIPGDIWAQLKFQAWMIPAFFAANALIGFGFKLAQSRLGSMTLTVAGSKSIDLLALVAASWLIFSEAPTWRTFAGIALVVVGAIVAKS